MSLFDRPKHQHRRPLDDRLAEREPREDGATPANFVKSRTTVRVDRADEVAALTVGALLLQKVDSFGQSRVFGRAVESLLEQAANGLTAEEMMRLEVEAYAIMDWLVGGAPVTDDDAEAIARRDGDRILYDPAAPPVALLRRAIDEGFDCKIDYFSRRRGQMNTRRVTPTALEAETYLSAYCHARQDDRVFRLNRITRCVPVKGRPIELVQRQAHDGSQTAPTPTQISLLDDD